MEKKNYYELAIMKGDELVAESVAVDTENEARLLATCFRYIYFVEYSFVIRGCEENENYCPSENWEVIERL